MSSIRIPEGYKPKLGVYDTQIAIGKLKSIFEKHLMKELNLKRVSAPLFVLPETGLNDNLNGVERPVSFEIADIGKTAEVVHSLAKWKRMALGKYSFPVGEGLYTNMNAIRRDEELDNYHSVYVDQWDWEKVVSVDQRTEAFLEESAQSVLTAVLATQKELQELYPALTRHISPELSIVTTQELEDKWPDKSARERENLYVKDHPTALIKKVGGALKSGVKHDGRAPDYDDWDLNGDILIWDDIMGMALEISSMGVRVDAESMVSQLKIADAWDRSELPFHKGIMDGSIPLSIGGGIGQSRVSMLLLEKMHIAEVQASVWDDETLDTLAKAGVLAL